LKYPLLFIILITSILNASIDNIKSFEADFTQNIKDEKDKILKYTGHVYASKPQLAKWEYITPVEKSIFISPFTITIVEPEIEQVIIRKIKSNFNFFQLIKNAKEIKKNIYEASYKNTIFTITKENKFIKSITYIDEFENKVTILFSNQKQNHDINLEVFTPKYPLEYDIIRD